MSRFNIQDWQNKYLFEKKGVKHYTKDGKEWTGATHKMPNGPLMTQDPHNKDSEELFHKEDLKEQDFDSKFKDAMGGAGFSDDEQDDVMSRDINKSFPSEPGDEPNDGYKAAVALKDELRYITYKKLSQEDLDNFSKEMVLHFLNNTTAQAAAKIFFGKRQL